LGAPSPAVDKSPDAFTGKVRRLFWTCRFGDCGRSFTTYTRRGLRVTCPHCHRVQEGPEGVRRLLEKVNGKAAKGAATVTTLKIVAANGAHKAQAKPKPPPRAATKPVAPPPAPLAPKKDLISRALGF
jgi:ribosomal protein S27E